MKFLIVISLLLCSCGASVEQMVDKVLHGKITGIEDPRTGCNTHPELVPYIRDFEEEYGRGIGDIPICVGDRLYPANMEEPLNTVGVCLKWTSPIRIYKAIIVRTSWFNDNKHDRYAMRQLIEHELGHCALNRVHNSKVDANGKQVSIMFPISFSGRHYRDNHQYYLDELFNRL